MSLGGRRFRDVTVERAGDVDGETVFEYHEEPDGTIWATYAGGGVRRGFLVGTRAGTSLDFRYAHATDRGETATGHCTSTMEELTDGRLRMHETWSWESKPGSGQSVIEEIHGCRVMNMGSQLSRSNRDRLRALHLVAGATLVLVVYGPAFDAERGRDLLRFLVVPVLLLSGVAMWKLPSLMDRFRRRRPET